MVNFQILECSDLAIAHLSKMSYVYIEFKYNVYVTVVVTGK